MLFLLVGIVSSLKLFPFAGCSFIVRISFSCDITSSLRAEPVLPIGDSGQTHRGAEKLRKLFRLTTYYILYILFLEKTSSILPGNEHHMTVALSNCNFSSYSGY